MSFGITSRKKFGWFSANTADVEVGEYEDLQTGAASFGGTTEDVRKDVLNVTNRSRIRQTGSITKVKTYIKVKDAKIDEFHFNIWRKNSSGTYDKIGGENIWAGVTADTESTITLNTPIAAQEGDFIGFHWTLATEEDPPGNFIAPFNDNGEHGIDEGCYVLIDSEPSASGADWENTGVLLSAHFPIKAVMSVAPVGVFIGGSTTSGIPNHRSFVEEEYVGYVESYKQTLAYYFFREVGLESGFTYQNMGHSGDSSTQSAARFDSDVVAMSPQFCYIDLGINDIFDIVDPSDEGQRAAAKTTYTGNITTMLQKCIVNNIIPVVSHIRPVDLFNAFEDAIRKDWNAELSTICARYDAIVLDEVDSYMGDPADNYINMRAVPDINSGDNVHIAEVGQAIAAKMLANKMRVLG